MRLALLGACARDSCVTFAGGLYEQMRSGYETCSVLSGPETLAAYRAAHRTARKRSNRSSRLGYEFVPDVAIHERADEIHEINISKTERQGRPMSAGYRERSEFSPDPEWECDRHRVFRYGVVDMRRQLVAYLWLHRSNDLALVSQILGHGAHLKNDVMWLLFEGVVAQQLGLEGHFVYNRHDSGTDGLRYYKEKHGFTSQPIEWTL